jgi:hypothetical protein
MTGRANVRAGAPGPRAAPPSIAVRVGPTPGVRSPASDVRLSWFGETRTEFRATGNEFTSVFLEAATNPLGACIFA